MKGLKLLYLNTRSLLRHIDEVRLSLLTGSFDIVSECVICGESWLHKNVSDSLLYSLGYTLYRCDRRATSSSGVVKPGGGVCAFVSDKVSVLSLDSFNVSNNDIEVLNLGLQKGDGKKFSVCGVYRPPICNIDAFTESLENCITNCTASFGGGILVAGDMNIDISKHKCSQKWKLLSLMDRLGLFSHVNSYTRITQKSATTIDLIFSNFSNVSSSGTINVNISDHLSIYLVKKKKREISKGSFIMGRSYRDLNENAFKEDICDIDPNYLFDNSDPNVVWSKMYSHFTEVVNHHCPIRRLKISVSKPGYLNTELIELMHDHDLAFKMARRSAMTKAGPMPKLCAT